MKIIIYSAVLIQSLFFSHSYAESIAIDSPVIAAVDMKIKAVVYRSPTCSCCSKWVAHLRQNNFDVVDNVLADMSTVKAQYGITPALASCHTAVIEGYVVEGHVPADDIKRMLKNKPQISGLTVPGMVVGTPGMEMGDRKDPYKVLAFDKTGNLTIYKSYDKY